ncbi:putative MRC1-like domain-containing protein [Seiridium unicorne]|uniref:MRC1-like domain-containing protein n=1 Tax=Seiridium unicorne TaxID=138068 RepID=A0ABR2VD42_9PEZI
MASTTRSPSPASDASPPGSPQLTPRSKLKAELAALDDSSDEDTGPIDRKVLFKPTEKLNHRSSEPAEASSRDIVEEENDEDEGVIRPRGRLAARMQANDTQEPDRSSKSPRTVSETVKKTTQLPQDSDADVDPNEDEVVTAVSRQRRIRPAREATPEVDSVREASPASPGLFVSPSKSQHSSVGSDSDNELPATLNQNGRFKALVARKREERLAREAEEKRIRDEKHAQRVGVSDEDEDDDVSDISDDDGGRKLTQEVSSRPAVRKASKKALEEMNRETQRLSRSMQLAHEAKTKKKISKSALFERFNFKLPGVEKPAEGIPATSSSRPATPDSVKHTDVEMAEKDTPPSSPPSALRKMAEKLVLAPAEAQEQQAGMPEEDELVELPSLNALPQSTKLDKGKGIAAIEDVESPKKNVPPKPKRQVRIKFPPIQANLTTIDLDDELQVAKPKKQSKIDTIFNRVPAQQSKEARSVHVLRQLAHLSSPPQDARKRKQKPSMTVGELQLNLQQRARAQAKLERDRRMEMLKAKGIHVQTEEEREKEREQVEDIVARARQEAEEIMAREREDAKKAKEARKANGEEDHLDWDDSDDDDFAGSEDEVLKPIEEGEIEFSGSDEEVGLDPEDEDDESAAVVNPMFDEDADEADVSEEEVEEDGIQSTEQKSADDAQDEEDMDDVRPTASKSRRSKKHMQVLSDDEDDVAIEATPKPKRVLFKSPSSPNSASPKVPTSVLRSATKTFIPGLPVPAAGPAGLGLTQIFAGTMDDSQAGSAPPATGSPMQFMPSFNNFPDSQFSATAGESQPEMNMILDSQSETQKRETQTQGVQLHFEQSQMHGFDSLMQMDGTQASDTLQPTQDAGFGEFTPLKQRFVDPPQSTVDTVLLNGTPVVNADIDSGVMDSPLVHKRGKLRRRAEVSFADSQLPPTEVPGSPTVSMAGPALTTEASNSNEAEKASAFKLMATAARKKKRALEKFNKKKSKAKEMVHGEAEESEDEYAGLGGADGEDSSEVDEDELSELRKQMIDDDTKGLTEEEEGKLAAFFADRERAADSAQVDKLFRDITTGMLRKRRRGGGAGNNDFDLSDSDDGGEARRRMKRKQFAKMQKALFADERIGKIAENPRNAAFMKSIEDWGSDDEMNLDEPYFPAEEESQSQTEAQPMQSEGEQGGEDRIPDSQPTATEAPSLNMGRKRTRIEPSEPAARPPPNLRRVRDGVKPASLAEVRRSLSSLLGEPNMPSDAIIPATDPNGSDSEGEHELAPSGSGSNNKENRRPGYVSVVDRISLKRSGSSNLSTSSKLAFAAPASTAGGTFKVPALLRRATTNSLMSQGSNVSAASSTGVTVGSSGGAAAKAGSGFGEEGKLKKNAGKKSGINFFARENERRERLKLSEQRREEKKWKGVEGRSKAVGGLFGGGRFE